MEAANSKGQILVVDDTQDSLKLINELLSEEGYFVRPANSGELALLAALKIQPELILLDLKMPGMDGMEVCRRLKQNKKTENIPVIFFSASTNLEERIEGLKIGAVDFILKPVQKEEMLARVKNHIELFRLRTKLENLINERTIELEAANEKLRVEINEHKRFEESLRESEAKFRAVFENSMDAIGVLKAGIFHYVNEAFVNLFGYNSTNNVIGLPIKTLISSFERDKISGMEINGYTGKEESLIYETTGLKSDGTTFIMDVHASSYSVKKEIFSVVILRDITEHKKYEENLRIANERFNLAAKVGNLGVWEWNIRENTSLWDDNMYNLYGVKREEFTGNLKAWKNCLLESQRKQYLKELRQALIEKDEFNIEIQIMRSGNELRYIKTLGSIIRDNKGKPRKVIGLNYDITESRANEEKIKQINQKNEDVLTAVKIAYWDFIIEKNTFVFNDRFLEMHNLTASEFSGYEIDLSEFTSRFVASEFIEPITERIRIAVSEDKRDFISQLECRLIKKGGEEFWVNMWFRLEKDEQGEKRMLKGIIQDITQRKKAELLYKQSVSEYHFLFENMLEGFAYCKMIYENEKPVDFIYLDVNASFETQTGLKNVKGKRVTEIIPGIEILDIELFQIYNEVALTGKQKKFEYFLESLKEWFSISVYSPERDYFVAVFDVVTERKQTELKIKNALKEKEALLKELYHRTKNNMQVINAFINLKRINLTDPVSIEILQEIESRIQTLALVHQKLYQSENLSRLSLKDYIVDLSSLLLKSYNVEYDKIKLELSLEDVSVLIDSAIPCGLIITEFLSNTIKHAFPGNRLGTIKILLSRDDEGFIILKLQDNGIGFNQNKIPSNSIGLLILSNIAREQLQGDMILTSDDGTFLQIRFLDNLYEERV